MAFGRPRERKSKSHLLQPLGGTKHGILLSFLWVQDSMRPRAGEGYGIYKVVQGIQVLESHVARQRTLKPSLATRPGGRMRFPVKEPGSHPDDQELIKTQVLNSIDNLLPSSPGKRL